MSENDSDSMESSKPLSETMIIKPDISRPKRKINNPWNVNDVSDFLKYCCPECDFTDQNLPQFTDHALENHVLSNILFNNTSLQEDSEIKSEHKDDIDYKSEYPGMEIKDEPIEVLEQVGEIKEAEKHVFSSQYIEAMQSIHQREKQAQLAKAGRAQAQPWTGGCRWLQRRLEAITKNHAKGGTRTWPA